FPHYSLLEGHDRFDRLPQPEARRFRPLHRDSCGFPAPAELLKQIGARDWFAPLQARDEADHAKRYCVEKDATTLPALALQVLDNFLASPRLVVAYALAGRVDLDLTREPIGYDSVKHPVMLHEIWPTPQEVTEAMRKAIQPKMFQEVYAHVFEGDAHWQGLAV